MAPAARIPRWQWLAYALLFALSIGVAGGFGAWNGYQSARQVQIAQQTQQASLTLQEQYDLGVQDLADGNYDVARQRFEYILTIDPGFPNAADRLAEAQAVLYATATPTPSPTDTPTPTPTSTRDLRPVEELFQQALASINAQDWDAAINTLQSLRKADPAYKVTQVDGMLYLSLRYRGVNKIYKQANLEGGTYDLSQAERFAPIDADADTARTLARLYMYGLAFWEVDPGKAAFYFGQVAAAMPGFHDSSGWTAKQRYHISLQQYGDLLANQKDWCDAKTQYELAQSIQPDPETQDKLEEVIKRCLGYTDTPLPGTSLPSATATPTFPRPPHITPTDTQTPPGPIETPTPTLTQAPPTATSTDTPPSPPTDTPAPTDTQAPPTDTPTPTDTQAPPPPTDTETPASPNGLAARPPQGPPSAAPLVFFLPWLFLPVLLAAMQPSTRPPKGPRAPTSPAGVARFWLPVILVVVLIVVSLLAGIGAYSASRQLALSWSDFADLSKPKIVASSGTPTLNALGTPISDNQTVIPTQGAIAPSLKPWDGAGRVTILLLGLDYRDWANQQEASRSDTMILLTMDPQAKTAGILSVPRDMWVAIPGFQHGKINTAYYLGDLYKMPGGGPALAVKTVEEFLGVEINYFAQIDFGAFVRFIDEIGGVSVDVPEQITVDLLGSGFRTKKTLKPGRQVLPGEWALAYARARHTEGGDFDRAFRQQQVIMGIRDRMLSPNMLPSMIAKAPTLYSELASGIRTNLTLDQVIQLALLAQTIPDQSIQRGIIGKESVMFGTSPDGLAILVPIPDKIGVLRDQVFTSSSSLGPQTPGTSQEQMQAEQAKIALYDASGNAGLLERTANYLRSQGANLASLAASDKRYTSTTIILHTGDPYTLKYLVDLMKISSGRILFKFDPNSPVDVEIYLGIDWARNNSLP